MLAYFPSIYPGELLYSVLARYHRHLGGVGCMHTVESLFGTRHATASPDLSGHLQALATRIPPERGLGVDRLIDALTLLPYYTAFEPPRVRAHVRRAMAAGNVANLHLRLGLAAFRVARVTTLRFCSKCSEEMLAEQGELYWRREHELPSVLVCPKHGGSLRLSTVSLARLSRHEFVAASPENCPGDARPLAPEADDKTIAVLTRLARASAQLLERPIEARTFRGWTQFYQRALMEVGLARSSRKMNQVKFERDFRKHFGTALEYLPGVMAGDQFAGDWLAGMVRQHRKAMHPIHHLLLQDFLAFRTKRVSPFGSGPWPCLNPLSTHYYKNRITKVTQHRNRGHLVGVFACGCGYVYTRSCDTSTQELGAPRFLQYGPLIGPELRRLVAKKASLRAIARRLELDPRTVVRLASELALPVVWKATPADSRESVPASSPRRPKAAPQNRAAKARRPAAPRRDWPGIDAHCAAKVKRAAAAIRRAKPPMCVTVAELERRIGRRGWFVKRWIKLPKTCEAVEKLLETVEAFQHRRIRWAITELVYGGTPLRAWRVMRKAGVRANQLAYIRALLAELPVARRAAA